MQPRWKTVALLLTMPVWFLPALVWVGWKEAGRYTWKDLPDAFRWGFLGRKPKGY